MAKALGTDDSINTCDCCGRTNLKFTVAIELDDGDIVHYGSTCATQPVKGLGLNTEIKAAVRQRADRVAGINRAAYHVYKAKGGKYVAHPTKPNTWVPADSAMYAVALAEVLATA